MITADNVNSIIVALKPMAEKISYIDVPDFFDKMNIGFESYVQLAGGYDQNFLDISEDDKEYILSALLDMVAFKLDECTTIAKDNVMKDDWLENANIEFRYTERYLTYLKNKGWNNINTFDKDSFKIIQMLGNPNIDGQMHRKGLLIGDIQSGKTANYTTILNRAVDVGFNVIIVLAGTTENLRKQTQERIDKELVGRATGDVGGTKIGVGKIEPLSNVMTATSAINDYSKKVASTQALSLVLNNTILLVTKKNVSTLKAISKALKQSNKDRSQDGIIDGSILILDDESDNASVDTNKAENDPTAINQYIRTILNSFARTAYLAVTATPFANIFIDDDLKEDTYSRDLFPSDFIALLDRPVQYMGAKELFCETRIDKNYRWLKKDETYSSYCVRRILDDSNTPYKFKHKADEALVGRFEDLPESLKYSIRYFILVQKLMDDISSVPVNHRTMMINVSRYVKVQENLFDVIDVWLKEQLVPQVRKYGYMPEREVEPFMGEYFNLYEVWKKENLEFLSEKTWKAFSPELASSINKIRAAVENRDHRKDGKGLHYTDYPDGDRVIVVGGQCLSRGLTLEGLVVSYFYRNSATYDTLLQMGRWFGYRDSYLKYFRLWISKQSDEWYQLISDACEDLREQIKCMNEKQMTPAQYGLAVRFHPATGLIVTARNKMRNVAKLEKKIPMDIRGRLIESARLNANVEINRCNKKLVEALLASMNGKPEETDMGIYWSGIDKEVVSKFVYDFQSARLSIGFKVEELSKYIKTNSTPTWSIGIAKPKRRIGQKLDLIPGYKLFSFPRPYEEMNDNGIGILKIYGHHVHIGAANVTRLGLNNEQLDKISFQEEKRGNSASFYLRNPAGIDRESILILYPMSLYRYDDASCKEWSENMSYKYDDGGIVWGIGLGFAGDKIAETVADCFSYVINPVAKDFAWDFADDEENDDE